LGRLGICDEMASQTLKIAVRVYCSPLPDTLFFRISRSPKQRVSRKL
jgi:hypothetical protein